MGWLRRCRLLRIVTATMLRFWCRTRPTARRTRLRVVPSSAGTPSGSAVANRAECRLFGALPLALLGPADGWPQSAGLVSLCATRPLATATEVVRGARDGGRSRCALPVAGALTPHTSSLSKRRARAVFAADAVVAFGRPLHSGAPLGGGLLPRRRLSESQAFPPLELLNTRGKWHGRLSTRRRPCGARWGSC